MSEETKKVTEEIELEEEMELEEEPTLLLSLEDGTEVTCIVLSIYDIEGKEYIALLPEDQDTDDEEEMDVYIYRFAEDAEGNPILDNIEDDAEYERAVNAFNDLFEEEGEYED